MNGIRVNGIRVNGIRVNGIRVNGIRVNGAALDARSSERPDGLQLDGAELAWTEAGRTARGADLEGTILETADDEGSTQRLRIDRVRHDANLDLPFYSVSAWSEGRWQDVCEGGDAVVLSGRWDLREGVLGGGSHIDDPGQVTFACRGYTLAKCVELGYRPWVSGEMRDLHQACTRMLRADYCGDGTPHTVDGVRINVFDRLGIQEDAGEYPVDAEWTPDGARCANAWWSTPISSRDLARLEALGARRLPDACREKLDASGRCGQVTPARRPLLVDEVVAAPAR